MSRPIPRSARPCGAVVDLVPDHDARLTAAARLLLLLADGRRRRELLRAAEAASPAWRPFLQFKPFAAVWRAWAQVPAGSAAAPCRRTFFMAL